MQRCWLVPLAFVFASLVGCGQSNPAATQVAARVNSDEITVHQIDYVLSRNPGVSAETAPRVKREILGRLVDQQLARQEAIDRKLDRNPAVMQAIEAARNEILARSYFEQIAAAQPRPTPEEVKRYYAQHPQLFAERRVFILEQITIASQPGLAQALREQVKKSRSMQDVAAWLKSKDAKFAESGGVRAAEQIPLDLLPKLQTVKDGEIQQIDGPGPLYVVHVIARKAAPVDEATATPRIQQFLFSQRLGEAIAKEMKAIKEKAEIEYVGEFAALPPESALQTEAAQPASAASAPSLEPSLEKGIRGLR